MKTLRVVWADQLSTNLSALRDIDPQRDVVLMAEVREEATYVRHHRQKLILLLSAMRHFAQELGRRGIRTDYVPLTARANSGEFTEEVGRAVARHRPERIVVTQPGEYRQWEKVRYWAEEFNRPVEVREDDRFLCGQSSFARWAEGRRQPRMEHFYRFMRHRTGFLLREARPVGGRWNYDSQNRKGLPRRLQIPSPLRFKPDAMTRDVVSLVESEFGDHFGEVHPFGWAVTRRQALRGLRRFVHESLPKFGDYQDAMKQGEDRLFHSTLSPYLNIGLLSPREVCEAAMEALKRGAAPLPAVEGFVRQILGWREYVRGIYRLMMPRYAAGNFLKAARPLPGFYWSGRTDMHCLHECIEATRRNAYAHHIQRLMVTGAFALLAGIDPKSVEEWYLVVYADAFEWVELPNTHGMALFADGGILGTKPYAASGAYIKRMSDYCGGCTYNPDVKIGPGACPFNYLYWNFLLFNQPALAKNPRLAAAYHTLGRMDERRRELIVHQAREFLDGQAPGEW